MTAPENANMSSTECKGNPQGRMSVSEKRMSVAEDPSKQAVADSAANKSTFVDAAAMKEKVRQNLCKPQHVVSDYYKKTGICQLIARSQFFDKFTLGIIALNAIWIAVDTDLNTANLLLDAHPVFVMAENLFCAYFSFEWFARYMSFNRKRDGLKDMWFVFDSMMVAMMVLETWCFTFVTLLVSGGSAGAGSGGILRVARVLRLTRMARMGRLLRAMPELMIMIKGMMAATRSVFFTLCLLLTIMYVFGVAFKQLADGTMFGSKHFSTVPQSMFTLLVYGTFLDSVGIFFGELLNEHFALNILFCVFVLLGSLTVMNMLVGVLCEVVSAVAATEQEEMLVTYVNDKLSKVMAMLDTDGGGTISKREFIEILDNVDAVRCLNDVGVDVFGLVDLADYIFEDDDSKNEDEVELDFSKFMEVVLQLRGTNQATVKDVVDLRKFMRQAMMENYKQTTIIIEQLKEGAEERAELVHKTDMQHALVTRLASLLGQSIVDHVHLGTHKGEVAGNVKCEATKAYKVEGGSSPLLPPQTAGEQLLEPLGDPIVLSNDVNVLAVEASDGGESEGLFLRGDWFPFESDRCSRDWMMPVEGEPTCLGEPKILSLTSSAEFAEAAITQTEIATGASRMTSAFKSPAWTCVDTSKPSHQSLSQSLDDFDMEAVQQHIDLICRHLSIGLNELLRKFQEEIHKASFPQRTKVSPLTVHSGQFSNPKHCAL
eukprot:TRINITY_DN2274_c0_g1_i2.p1 TRINITY_DN2274_c0_g1~~TRINITY_DN2274_c0_g1_i2.p1  ORF type:complete len:730 (+),score=121.52 TRINITY_DN2274_c0_g1_i2:51-2192(+)